jgi:hypothetical protein
MNMKLDVLFTGALLKHPIVEYVRDLRYFSWRVHNRDHLLYAGESFWLLRDDE